jgi:hypothetical protein
LLWGYLRIVPFDIGMTFAIARAELRLEKEKEQIENAFDMGRDETTRKFIEDGEQYYNQTYNNETIN